jgi:predicted transcriptional regulator
MTIETELLGEKEVASKIASDEGLSFSQAKIYLTLERNGPLAFESISETLDMEKTEVYRAVLRLQKRGFVHVGEVPRRVYPLRARCV